MHQNVPFKNQIADMFQQSDLSEALICEPVTRSNLPGLITKMLRYDVSYLRRSNSAVFGKSAAEVLLRNVELIPNRSLDSSGDLHAHGIS